MNNNTYKRYALVTLTATYTLSFMDRAALGVVMQSLKEDLLLSDTQLGFLTGIVFALFYATMGIPIARWADRGNRVSIISLAMFLWGGMVMLCGVVTNFFQLLLVRIGAAVGEAGCMPPAYSLIGDYFSVSKRTRALSIYMSAIPISMLLGYIVAGWVNESFGWRSAFLLIGMPGLIVAVIVKITLWEPRQHEVKLCGVSVPQQSVFEVANILWKRRSFRNLVIGLTLVNFVGIGLGQWMPTFFIRSHDMTSTEVGMWMGLIGGISGALGIFLGGYIADRYLAHSARFQVNYIAIGVVLLAPLYLGILLLADKETSLLLLLPLNVLILFFYGPVMALIQRLVENQIRAIAIAITLLILNLFGMGLGPQVVGILSDLLSPILGIDALRAAMFIAALVSIGSAYYFWISGKTIEQDLVENIYQEVDMKESRLEAIHISNSKKSVG